jgi:hypothetical protein
MADYTEFVLNCEFGGDTPSPVIYSLKCLVAEPTQPIRNCLPGENLPQGLLQDNVYFALNGDSSLKFEEANGFHYLSVHAKIRDNNGYIEQFLSWIAPYSQREGFVGYVYSAIAEYPTLIYFANAQAAFVEISLGDRTILNRLTENGSC